MSKENMRKDLEAAVQEMVGLPLWASGRAANMQWFQFGARRSRTDRRGVTREIGTYALHVECAWRVVGPEGVVVGAADVDYDVEGALLEIRESAERSTRLDARLKRLLDSEELRVIKIDVSDLTFVKITLSAGHVLELVPMDSLPSEQWRLLKNVEPAHHWVVSGAEVERL